MSTGQTRSIALIESERFVLDHRLEHLHLTQQLVISKFCYVRAVGERRRTFPPVIGLVEYDPFVIVMDLSNG
jgi:hypothetical protein